MGGAGGHDERAEEEERRREEGGREGGTFSFVSLSFLQVSTLVSFFSRLVVSGLVMVSGRLFCTYLLYSLLLRVQILCSRVQFVFKLNVLFSVHLVSDLTCSILFSRV